MKVEIQVSVGELFDKISILKIKKARIKDDKKLFNNFDFAPFPTSPK